MPVYKLRYFPMRGRAEVARQLFALSGTKYEDDRIPMDQWPAHKAEAPFGQVPVLEIDGVVAIGQSVAITRYLARKFGYAGKTPIEEALVDSLVDQFVDYFGEIRQYFAVVAGFAPGDKDKIFTEIVVPAVDKLFPILTNWLKKAGSGYLVGSSLTSVDLLVVEHVTTFQSFNPDFAKAYPEVQALVKKVHAEPAIAKWLETRPVTQF